MKRVLLLLAVVASLTVCKGADGADGLAGPQGPQGPIGPPGPQGPAGAVNRADYSGLFDASGIVTGLLPASSTAGGRVPVIACYISEFGVTWLAVAQVPSDLTFPFCALVNIGSSAPGVRIVNGIPGWRFYMIAVW